MDEKKIGKTRSRRGTSTDQAKGAPVGSNGDGVSLANGAVWDALRSPVRLQMLEAIRCRPGVDAGRLAKALDSSPPRLYYHLKILLEAGLIRESRNDDAQDERSARGPSAVGYRATHDDHPQGFFDGDGAAVDRSARLLSNLAQAGIESVLSPATSTALADFRHEALEANEIEAIGGHIEAIRAILTEARARRRSKREIVRATAFVGVCIAELERAVLPDGPTSPIGRGRSASSTASRRSDGSNGSTGSNGFSGSNGHS
ncbi:MAG: Helix-turn-helix domain [Planctomycetota bacterium]